MTANKGFKLCTLFLFFGLTGFPSVHSAPKEEPLHPLLRILETELNRSINQLKFEDFKTPYFVSYQLMDSQEYMLSARYGTIVQDQFYKNRYLYTELRYGNYKLDNTDENYRGMYDSASLEDDEADTKHRLWLMTDRAYKQAVKDHLQKQGKKISEIEKEKLNDFTREKPVRAALDTGSPKIGLEAFKPLLKATSGEFKKYKEVLDSGITLRSGQKAVYHVNSEGTRLITAAPGNQFFVYLWARTQAEDGMNLDVSRTFSIRFYDRLPAEAKLIQTIEEMTKCLLKLRESKLTDPYTGPAILDSESTGVLFHEAVGHRLEGERQRDEEEGQTFKGQIGKEIIPAFLTVTDDPTQAEAYNEDLNGFYVYDEEAVPAQKVVLVENGVLRNYLLSRRPISGFSNSNGHGRAQFGRDPIGRMSNLFVKSAKEFSREELKKMLLEECKKQNKPYGIYIKRTRSGDTFTGRGRYQAFRGTPEEVYLIDANTGEETLVRGVEIVGTPLITINKIIATGNEYEVSNAYCGAESGTIPVSTVAPLALVKEIELQRVKEDRQRPPILSPPLYGKK